MTWFSRNGAHPFRSFLRKGWESTTPNPCLFLNKPRYLQKAPDLQQD
jgi:hypothetical protein